MRRILIIEHVCHGRTILQSAIDNVLEKEIGITLVINSQEIKDHIIQQNILENITEIEPSINDCVARECFEKPKSKYIDKPRNNYKKR